MYILVYIDGIIVTTSDSNFISKFIHQLSSYFPVKDLEPLHFFLGIELTCSKSGLFLSQCKYIPNLLHRTNMHNSKPVSTPMSHTAKLTALDGNSFEHLLWYRSVINSLQYLFFTRLDISFALNRVCQYIHAP